MAEQRGSWLTVVGIGPGSPAYLTPAAREAAEQAKVLIGGKRALALFKDLPVVKYRLTGDLESLAAYLKKIYGQPTAVLVSGDPGFYSLLPWLKRQFPGEEIRVIPGISSMQMAFARLGATWEEATFLSLHGRETDLLKPFLPALHQGTARLVLLTGGRNSPAAVGRYLATHGLGEYPVWVGVELGSDTERCLWLQASELAGLDLPEAVVVLGYD
ncbi:MAG: cobalt-precorrin-7 (C5)-methyltransferase [Clostridia bacterium]|nr:cobalt-precorrin-7 (C5)-methyltransferase [Clostridia bacterium]